jgi:site-specific recombinase XerD
MRRKVESPPLASPVDAHERTRDSLSEEDCALLLQGTPHSRYRWRNAAMLMLTFYHGLRVTELCRLRRQDVDLTHGRLWMQRLKGSRATEQPLHADARRTLKRYVKQRGNAPLPWLWLNERGAQLTRSAIHDLVGRTGVRAGLTLHVHPHRLRHGCGDAWANRGDALRLMQDSLGHRDPKQTTR